MVVANTDMTVDMWFTFWIENLVCDLSPNTKRNCGMQPKVLQKLLGHKRIKTTMDRYVHVTDDSMTNAVRQFEVSLASA